MNALVGGIIAIALCLGVAAWAVNSRADAMAKWASAVAAAQANAQQVEAMTARLKVCVGEETARKEAQAQIEDERQSALRERERAVQAERQRVSALYEQDADCAAWGRARICPAIDGELRPEQ